MEDNPVYKITMNDHYQYRQRYLQASVILLISESGHFGYSRNSYINLLVVTHYKIITIGQPICYLRQYNTFKAYIDIIASKNAVL